VEVVDGWPFDSGELPYRGVMKPRKVLEGAKQLPLVEQ
jgi:hypothetical protein